MPPPVPKTEADAITITVRLDGVPYVFRPGDVSALDVSACRRATGMGINAVMQAAQSDPDIDTFATLVWLARRQNGEPLLQFDEVLKTVNYDSDIEVDEIPESKTDDAGEVLAAG